MANLYEIAVVYDPGLEVDLEKATTRIEKIFTDNGGEVTKTDNWGKRKLAYPIKKHESGIYVFYTVMIPGENVRKIESTLNITDEVIRFLITRPDPKKQAKADAMRAKQAARRSNDSEEVADDKEEK
jgi:small subunit ribosomal protein S6